MGAEHWDVAGPSDIVAHSGESMTGDFCWTVTLTDVHTQWTETRATWNKGQYSGKDQFQTALNRIKSGKLPPGDPGFHTLFKNPATIHEITHQLRGLIQKFEESVSM